MLVAMSRHETQDECMHLETKADLASKKRRIRIKRPVSYTYIYTGCPRRKGPNFGRVFLRSNYTDITENTYIQSSTVTEILAREV